MNTDVLAGKWKQFAGSAKARWAELTEDDWKEVSGKTELLMGKLQERYGWMKERAQEEISKIVSAVDSSAENLADKAADAKQVAGCWQDAVTEMACACRNQATRVVRQRPGTTLLAAVAVGFVAAHMLRSRK